MRQNERRLPGPLPCFAALGLRGAQFHEIASGNDAELYTDRYRIFNPLHYHVGEKNEESVIY